MRSDWASEFIDDNFDPDDRLAVVLIDRHSGPSPKDWRRPGRFHRPSFRLGSARGTARERTSLSP